MKRYWIVCAVCNAHSVTTDPANRCTTQCLACMATGQWHTSMGVIYDPEMVTPSIVPFGGQIVATVPASTAVQPIVKKAVHHPFAPKDDWRSQ